MNPVEDALTAISVADIALDAANFASESHTRCELRNVSSLLRSQAERIGELEKGLEVFARAAVAPLRFNPEARKNEPFIHADTDWCAPARLTWGDFRRARALLDGGGG